MLTDGTLVVSHSGVESLMYASTGLGGPDAPHTKGTKRTEMGLPRPSPGRSKLPPLPRSSPSLPLLLREDAPR